MTSPTSVYWAVIRDQTQRKYYIELEQLKDNRWNVLLEDEEFILESTSTDFFDLLEEALTRRHLENR